MANYSNRMTQSGLKTQNLRVGHYLEVRSIFRKLLFRPTFVVSEDSTRKIKMIYFFVVLNFRSLVMKILADFSNCLLQNFP